MVPANVSTAVLRAAASACKSPDPARRIPPEATPCVTDALRRQIAARQHESQATPISVDDERLSL